MEKWENPALYGENLMDAHATFHEDGVSLGGKWRFFSQNTDLPLPHGWESPEFNDKKWSRISVPGSWEAQEICPVYAGNSMDTTKNLTGLYRRSFILSKDQGSRQIVLRFEAVSACALVWVNGTYIGMTKGMGTPAEFDITSAVCQEKNTIAVQVLADCGISSTEGQFRASGILGDVTLYSLPARAITRLETSTCWQEDGTPTLHISLCAREAEGFTARTALMDGNRVVSYCESMVREGHAEADLPCPDVELWCAERPKLYRVAVILWDGIAMYHTRELTIAFRRLERRNTTVFLNGQPEKLFAVEYQAFNPNTGCYRSTEQMEQDLTLLRTHHLNAIVLTSPAPDELYSICDRLGVYVLDHSCSDSSTEASREQSRRMARTFGYHSSILFRNCPDPHPDILPMDNLSLVADPSVEQLSAILGTESEANTDSRKMRKLPRASAPSEPDEVKTILLSLSRIPGNMDMTIGKLRETGHMLGAVFGSLRCDHPSGLKGLLDSDGSPTAALRELRVLLQPMKFTYDSGTITVTNHSRFCSTASYQCRYLLTRDGEAIVNRELDLEVAPGDTESRIVETEYDIFKAGRYHLTVGYVHPQTGASVASAQWEIAHLRHIFDENPGGTIREEQGSLLLRSQEAAYTVNRSTGALEQILLEDRPILTGPVCPVFAPDSEKNGGFLRDEWEKMTFSRKKQKPSVLEVDHMTRTVSASYKLGSGLIQNCRLYSDGSMAFELRLRTGRTAPALVGVCLPIDPELARFRWFGMGPDDAAPEHQAGRFFSVHTQDASASAGAGMKDPVYHLTVTDGSGFGLMVRSEEGLRASCRRDGNSALLRLELCAGELKPHTTYIFPFILQPIRE